MQAIYTCLYFYDNNIVMRIYIGQQHHLDICIMLYLLIRIVFNL